MFIQDEALGAMFRDTLLVFGGHRVNDKLVLPDLVFREEGDGTVGIEGGLMDLQQDRNAIVSFHFDEGSDNGDLGGPGGFWIIDTCTSVIYPKMKRFPEIFCPI